jgi:hypothetical protein
MKLVKNYHDYKDKLKTTQFVVEMVPGLIFKLLICIKVIKDL